jgi:preprotein translocase subunit SecD
MLNQYPLWKYLLILAVLVVGALYALPNLYGEDPAVQISATRGAEIGPEVRAQVASELQEANIKTKRIEQSPHGLLVRFYGEDAQLKAQDLLRTKLGPNYVEALNLAPSTPGWLTAIGALPMYLGLDLRGGVHFLMQVDMKAAIQQAQERYYSDLRTMMRDERLRYQSITQRPDGAIAITFNEAGVRNQVYDRIRSQFSDLTVEKTGDETGKPGLLVTLSDQQKQQIRTFALQQNITTLRNRVNELGVSEPVIQQQGQDRIVVELPGVQDTARAKEILGATATLEFHMVDEKHSVQAALQGQVPPGSRLYYTRDGRPVLLYKDIMLTGDYITDASSGIEQQTGSPAVFITLNNQGARLFSKRTADKIGRRMAVVFIENQSETHMVQGKPVQTKRKVEEVINIAVIRDQLGKRFQITGLDNTEEARNLALLLRAGALAAPMDIVEERTVGPSLGQQNIEQGFEACLIGFLLVVFFMGVYYRLFGVVANLALLSNLVIIIAVMSMIQATLTLPGIAGIVLTTGMAVDANVLIFERVREELRNGNTPQASIHAGYERALSTIIDSNVTTLIAALALFGFGTGPVKGFAVTLSIGIATSMFTAIMGTRALINLMYGGRRVRSLSI